MTTNVICQRHGPVLQVTLARPEKKNALTGEMYDALIAAIDEADSDVELGALLLEGVGGTFTAGNDLNDFLKHASDFSQAPALRFLRRLVNCETPVVVAVEGPAIGVGTTMLFHCDLVYATKTATFRMPFIDLGVVPEAAATLLVPRQVGKAKTAEWLMLGDGFDAVTAERFGIVNAIVDQSELHALSMGKALELSRKPRAAMRATRRLIRGDRKVLLERIDEEARIFAGLLKSPEAFSAMTSFLAKSKNLN